MVGRDPDTVGRKKDLHQLVYRAMGMNGSRILGGALLRAQRSSRLRALVPPFARRRLVGLISPAVAGSSDAELVDDWSRPLVPTQCAPPRLPATGFDAPRPTHRNGYSAPRRGAQVSPTRDGPRCLLATSSFDVGGMDEMVAFLARELRLNNFETAVLHTDALGRVGGAKGRLGRSVSAAGIEVAVLPEESGRQWLRDWRPDVISAHGALPWVLDEARVLAVPYVDVLHGMHSLFDADWELENQRNQSIAAIVAVSDLVRRQYLERTDFPADRVIVIPNGVDAARRPRVDRARARAALGLADEFLFVSLARHCVQKNTFALVSAFEEVACRQPKAHLLVAGRPDDRLYCKQVRRLRDGLAARDRVHLRDHATDPAMVLSAADGFVLDSFFEGWALASMEALHAGVPVVASDVGGAREQLGEAGSRGYLIDNPLGDPLSVSWRTMRSACFAQQVNRDELVSAMSALVQNRERWRACRDDLAAESAERFHPARCIGEHAALLRSVAHAPTAVAARGS